ncbi:MAG TPA: patatin-like phospholipase family protein, partial [Burkholderiaceae bacterium]|nr:patatin-like phospholipase family protein [Burkholderiaceae bacterium]
MNRPSFDTIALVLQGGGALGAYQAGVMEGLAEAGIEPDWVAGISIGAINGAIIAGNAPEHRMERLRAFWETVSQPGFWPAANPWLEHALEPVDDWRRQAWNGLSAWRALVEGQRGFFTPRPVAAYFGPPSPSTASFYDTAPLKATLERLVDFDRINAGETRLTVSAVDVATGNFEVFDNRHGRWRKRIRAEHVMASGALPPGFPAVGIEDPAPLTGQRDDGKARATRYYWDGGLVSNTPLSQILDDTPHRDTLAFQVDVWSARGNVPTNVVDAQERMKDIQYSSRTRMVTDTQAVEQRERRLLRELLERIPPAVRDHDPVCRAAAQQATGRSVCVVQLVYQEKRWDGLAKDYEFGAVTMRSHWASGLADIERTLAHPHWLARPEGVDRFATHDIHRFERRG